MEKKILASYDAQTIRVYQAYNPSIAEEAVRLGHFGSRFKMERMTWIKPSFLWMMYRSGWATKEGQERILAIDLSIEGFREILHGVVLSTYNQELYQTKENWQEKGKLAQVRCQWDPDKDIYLQPMDRKAIQLGIRGEMVPRYVHEWTKNITDITEDVHETKRLLDLGEIEKTSLPTETEFPLTVTEKKILGITK
ncbi:DUF4291 domain-containing protein [Enterococcus sp. BWR-S5]|uniref:DUF4291 domain-containing protein n=1 Tax=Enterococcus sp. BWR-S5 TaxID=2787714 RepID=UPI001920BC3D|nr:DUF4291 domain-containing protein [Enterococcus sp. BWR-S5]MBL1225752.1 DUF4291 domain-containing protein [Enterococcus sp. BWR-S5]